MTWYTDTEMKKARNELNYILVSSNRERTARDSFDIRTHSREAKQRGHTRDLGETEYRKNVL